MYLKLILELLQKLSPIGIHLPNDIPFWPVPKCKMSMFSETLGGFCWKHQHII